MEPQPRGARGRSGQGAARIEDTRRLAADAERRRIERDLHDGAQQHLVGLAVHLRLARDLADSEPAKARRLLDCLRTMSRRRSSSSAISRTGSIHRCFRIAVSLDASRRPRSRDDSQRVSTPRDRALRAGRRGHDLLLLSRGAAECREIRRRLRPGHGAGSRGGGRASASRSRTTEPASIQHDAGGHGVDEHARPGRRARRSLHVESASGAGRASLD